MLLKTLRRFKEYFERRKRVRMAWKVFRNGYRASGWSDEAIDWAIKAWGFGPNINKDGWVEKRND